MSVSDPNAALDALEASLAAALPGRHVQRGLTDPAAESADRLTAGVVCVVSEGGGQFANYRGREGDLGQLQVALVGYLQVAENTGPEAIEVAELQLLRELLAWCNAPGDLGPLDSALPTDFTQSKQLEHPYGWLVLRLDVRP